MSRIFANTTVFDLFDRMYPILTKVCFVVHMSRDVKMTATRASTSTRVSAWTTG